MAKLPGLTTRISIRKDAPGRQRLASFQIALNRGQVIRISPNQPERRNRGPEIDPSGQHASHTDDAVLGTVRQF
jgi:methyl coenzyme M reductase alpha subunit